VIHLIPIPILMAMFSASIVGFVTRMVEATVSDAVIAGPMVAAYVAGRWINKPRVPPVGLAVIAGLLPVMFLGRFGIGAFELAAPQVVVPQMAVSAQAVLTVSLPMVILVLGLGHVQGLGFLAAQGYRVPSDAVTIAVGAMSLLNATFGGHPAAMTRVSSAILAAPDAGPLAGRYWSALVAATLATTVALTTGVIVALIGALPAVYVFTMAGLAILGSFEDALTRAFSGGLRLGATVAFGVTLATFTVAGIPSAFWALGAGLGASLIAEREELLESWRKSNA
jgi:benzoate membrane transport protein